MKLIGAFVEFARRVLSAAGKGGLGKEDMGRLDHLLTRTGKRNTILAKGILSAMSAGGAGRQDIERFGKLLERADSRIIDSREPFTQKERNELTDIFKRAYISQKTARWFSTQMDELVAEEIREFISGKRKFDIEGVPLKKTVRFEEESEKEKPSRKQAR